MSVDPKLLSDGDEEVASLARELGEAITGIPEYQAFADAKRAVENDEELQEKISEFEELRQDFMLAQQTGEAGQEDVERLERIQTDIESHPLMAEYNEAKDDLVFQLAEVNAALSEPLPFDFAGEAGGCCND
ncbi:YlbF family regulator [Halobacteriaceae archaeon GCM10025711]